LRQISIKGVGTIRKPKEGKSIFSHLLYILTLLLYPIIVIGGLITLLVAGCLSFFQGLSRTKKERERLNAQLTDGAATFQWTYWTEINGLKLYQKLNGEIRFGPAYFSVKSEPIVIGLNGKIFGDWFFQHEEGLFLQKWNSTKTPDTDLLHIDSKDLQVTLVKQSLPSVNWQMSETKANTLQLFCDTGQEILNYVIKTKKSAS
jgi:hypothetical protein